MKTNDTAVSNAADGRGSAGWSSYACPNDGCPSTTWLAKRVPGFDDMWHVTDHPDASPALVAATNPICPRCGTDLAVRLELRRETQGNESALMHWMWR